MNLSENTIKEILAKVRDNLQVISFGKIIIELQETSDVVDVTLQTRDRVKKKPLLR